MQDTNTDDARPEDIIIEKLIAHPEYRPPSSYNDIALLKLAKMATLSPYARPACLNTDTNFNRLKAIATGWGRVGYSDDPSEQLLKVTLEFFTGSQCNATYKAGDRTLRTGIQDVTQMCAGSRTEAKDTCQVNDSY